MATTREFVPPRSRGARLLRARHSLLAERVLLPIERFIHSESVSAAILFAASVAALVWANSPWRAAYFNLWHYKLTFDFGFFILAKDLHHWINDGLMAVFFFVIGLEMKAELSDGELSSPRQAALPAIAALGGMLAPAAIYLFFNGGGPAAHGWGIPMATDIAFAVGVMALLSDRVPLSLRTFLLALAVADDIGAIIVIAVFHTASISTAALGVAAVLLLLLVAMKVVGVRSPVAFAVPSIIFWAAVLESGVHATIAGVVLGLLTPTRPWFDEHSFLESAGEVMGRLREAVGRGAESEAAALLGQLDELTYESESPVARREREIRPWVSYVVLPLFALCNAGIDFSSIRLREAISDPVTIGVFVGLIAGKLVGVLGAVAVTVATGLSQLPEDSGWPQMISVALLAGIGFTVSLFITDLAFRQTAMIPSAKLGILSASVLCAAAGYLALRYTSPRVASAPR